MRRLLVFVLAVVCFHARAAEKSEIEYWRDTGLSYQVIESQVTTERCYRDLKFFHACINALNAVLATRAPATALFPKERIQTNPLAGEALGAIGEVFLARLIAPTGTRAKAFAKFKAERQRDRFAWERVFDRGKPKVRFERLVSAIKDAFLTPETEAAQTARGLNGYLSVIRDPHTYLLPTQFMKQRELVGGPAHFISHFMIDGGNLEKWMVTDRGVKLGFLKLRSFLGRPSADLRTAIQAQTAAGAQGFILDLRDNPGGPVMSAINVMKLFAPKGRHLLGVRRHYNADDLEIRARLLDFAGPFLFMNSYFSALDYEKIESEAEPLTKLPLVILVNADSASCSELVAGSLQDMSFQDAPRAFIVGQRTYGKGTMQGATEWQLDGITIMKTMAYMERLSGSFQLVGIHPDLERYVKPDPSEDDKFAIREEDKYWTALPAREKLFRSKHQDAIKNIQDCVAKDGQADIRWTMAARIKPDYQALSAQDALLCKLKN